MQRCMGNTVEYSHPATELMLALELIFNLLNKHKFLSETLKVDQNMVELKLCYQAKFCQSEAWQMVTLMAPTTLIVTRQSVSSQKGVMIEISALLTFLILAATTK